MNERVLVPLAGGFEEIEAVTIVDVLRRAEVDVTVAGLEPGPLTGARGIQVVPDVAWADVEPLDFDVLVLPGGLGGTLAMMEDERLLAGVRGFRERKRLVAAICAAPMVLAKAGVVDGVPVTSHPSVRERLGAADVRAAPRVLRADGILTSQGPGTALEFALALVEELRGADVRRDLEQAMVVA